MLTINGKSYPNELRLMVKFTEPGPIIEFPMRGYQRFHDEEFRENAYSTVNRFFSFMSEGQQYTIAQFYTNVDNFMRNRDVLSVANMIRYLQSLVSDMVVESDLVARLDSFCKCDEILLESYPNLKNAGSWEENTEVRTFGETDYQWLTAISIIGKIMVPVWGRLADYIRQNYDIRENAIDLILLDLIGPIIRSTKMHRTYRKLERGVELVVNQKVNNFYRRIDVEGVLHQHQMTMVEFAQQVFATVMVKRLVVFEPVWRSGEMKPNVMIFVDDGVKRNSETLFTVMSKKYDEAKAHRPAFLGGDLFFSLSDAQQVDNAFVRVIRTFFVGEKITNDMFTVRYQRFAATQEEKDLDFEARQQRMQADIRFIRSPRVITEKMARNVIDAMGYTVVKLEKSDTRAELVLTNRQNQQEVKYTATLP